MNCQICYNDYDHSVHKPYSLSNCSHTFCIDCLNKLTSNKCPICKAEYKSKHPNLSLMEFIPKSSFDITKEEFEIVLKKANILESNLKSIIDKKRDENISKIQDLKTEIRLKRDDLIKLINNNVTKLEDELSIYEASLQYSTKSLDTNSCSVELYLSNISFKSNEIDEAQMKKKLIDIQNIKTKLDDFVVKATNYNESIQFIPLNSIDAVTGCFGVLKDERNFEYFQQMANHFLFENKMDESLCFFKKAIQTKPNRIQLQLICSSLFIKREHFKKNKYNEVLDCFNLIINANTNDPCPYFYKAEILQYFKMLPEAIYSYNEAHKIDPKNARIIEARKRALKIYEDERRRSHTSNAENIEPQTKKQKV